MIDKSIPYYPLIMAKRDTDNYPKYKLPDGYEIVFYKDGDARIWSEVQTSVGSFESVERGIEVFKNEFLINQKLKAEERVIFVKAPDGEYIASAALWCGDHYNDKTEQRLHWIATKDTHSGKGIAKAMLTYLMDLYNELGYNGFIYLTTGTRNYPAVRIYQKFGFEIYDETKSLFKDLTDKQFTERNKIAIDLVNKMLSK